MPSATFSSQGLHLREPAKVCSPLDGRSRSTASDDRERNPAISLTRFDRAASSVVDRGIEVAVWISAHSPTRRCRHQLQAEGRLRPPSKGPLRAGIPGHGVSSGVSGAIHWRSREPRLRSHGIAVTQLSAIGYRKARRFGYPIGDDCWWSD